jgi:hypothetical protein
MGQSQSTENKNQQARKQLDNYIENMKGYGNYMMFSCSWENENYYVCSSRSSLDDRPLNHKIYYKKLLFSDCNPDPENDCAICLSPLNKNVVKTEHCSHKFHKKCIQNYVNLNRFGKCPMCRSGNDADVINSFTDTYSSGSSYHSDGF